MKTPVCFVILFLFLKSAFAQDTILQTNGTSVLAVVQEVGVADIKYKKYENRLTSPVYIIPKYAVNRINYADGTTDAFTPPVVAAVAIPNTTPITNRTPSSAIYFGAGTTPFSRYDKSGINSYWQNLFAKEEQSASGNLKLSTGNAMLYDFYMGASVIGNKQNNWTFEEEFETSSDNSVSNSALFADGTKGSLALRFSSLNTTFQYTHGLDTTNRFQIGMEASLDVGFMTGKEQETFYNPGYFSQNTVTNTTYEGVGMGGDFALVGKYFLGKSKSYGVVLKVGDRKMQTSSDNYSFSGGSGMSTSVNWGGPFVSVGLMLQLNIKPSPYQYSYCGCGC
jgi:hypothetical protein